MEKKDLKKIIFFSKFVCKIIFFIIFGKNFKSLAPKMAELFLNQKKKFGQKNFKSAALFCDLIQKIQK